MKNKNSEDVSEAIIMQMFQTILGIFHIAFGIYLINPSEDSIFRGHPLTIILIVLTFILGIGRLKLAFNTFK